MSACLLTVSDRASQGVYEDLSGPAMRDFLANKVGDGTASRQTRPSFRRRFPSTGQVKKA